MHAIKRMKRSRNELAVLIPGDPLNTAQQQQRFIRKLDVQDSSNKYYMSKRLSKAPKSYYLRVSNTRTAFGPSGTLLLLRVL